MALWPILLMINELPFKHRKLRENMVLSVLWFGPTKPLMTTFTKPLQKSLKDLQSGFDGWVRGKIECCKAFLMCLTFQLKSQS